MSNVFQITGWDEFPYIETKMAQRKATPKLHKATVVLLKALVSFNI